MVALRYPEPDEPTPPESLTRRRLRKEETMRLGRLAAALAWKRETLMLPLWQDLMALREQPYRQHGGACPDCRCTPRHRTCALCAACRALVYQGGSDAR